MVNICVYSSELYRELRILWEKGKVKLPYDRFPERGYAIFEVNKDQYNEICNKYKEGFDFEKVGDPQK